MFKGKGSEHVTDQNKLYYCLLHAKFVCCYTVRNRPCRRLFWRREKGNTVYTVCGCRQSRGRTGKITMYYRLWEL